MALSKTFEYRGLVVKNGYHKVGYLSGNKESVIVNVEKFTNDKQNIIDVENYSFVPNMNGENFIKQAYEYLKTLPEFADAQDC